MGLQENEHATSTTVQQWIARAHAAASGATLATKGEVMAHRHRRWLPVLGLLAGLQVGCQAPAPPAAPTQDALPSLHIMDQRLEREQALLADLLCLLTGLVAVTMLDNRDTMTLAMQLATVDRIMQETPGATNGQVLRQLALAVYTHPTWTHVDTWHYGVELCRQGSARPAFP